MKSYKGSRGIALLIPNNNNNNNNNIGQNNFYINLFWNYLPTQPLYKYCLNIIYFTFNFSKYILDI